MEDQNYIAYQALLEVAERLVDEINNIKSDPLDDEIDKESKHATRLALNHALGIVYEQLGEVNIKDKK